MSEILLFSAVVFIASLSAFERHQLAKLIKADKVRDVEKKLHPPRRTAHKNALKKREEGGG